MDIRYTPIKCYRTKVALYIGDFVEDLQKRCGTLEWDGDFNIYYIRPLGGGRIKTQSYIKIEKPYEYKIDTTNVECRRNPRRKKW